MAGPRALRAVYRCTSGRTLTTPQRHSPRVAHPEHRTSNCHCVRFRFGRAIVPEAQSSPAGFGRTHQELQGGRAPQGSTTGERARVSKDGESLSELVLYRGQQLLRAKRTAANWDVATESTSDRTEKRFRFASWRSGSTRGTQVAIRNPFQVLKQLEH